MPIDPEAARAAVRDRIAGPLGLPPERAAHGIFDVVNANMIGGIRSVSVERGHDPRDFSLVAGGGATSAHAGRLAAELGIRTTIVPRVASGLCAFGEAVADVKHTYLASYTAPLTRLDPSRLNELFLELEQRGETDLAEEGFGEGSIDIERSLDMKYVDQVHECNVSIPRFEVTAERLHEIEDAFHRRHEALYTYSERDNTPELINVEVNVYGRSPEPLAPQASGNGRTLPPPREERAAYFQEFGEYRPTPVYAGVVLQTGQTIDGPAIVEEETTTIVVFPGSMLQVPAPDIFVMRPTSR
jgi:N-methylhydantoinase A